MTTDRRRFLRLCGVGGIGAIAGCPADETPTADQATATTTETTTETAPPLQNPTQQAKLTANDGDAYDWFGSSVALSSDSSTAVIGAYTDDDPNGDDAGSAYVFDGSGSSWTQQIKLVPNDGDSGDGFGVSVALSSDGSTALIGAFNDEDPNGALGAGSAYVFDNSGDSWTQQAKLAPDDGDSGRDFGISVALSSDGSTALIGDRGGEDPNGYRAGAAYVFDNSGDSWTQQVKLAPDDGNSGDDFGISVALSSDGSTALIGAHGDEDPNGERAGSAYVFDSTGNSWTQRAKLVPDDGDSGDGFGVSIALSSDGSAALIGAYHDEDPNGEDAGSAYVFDGSGSSWSQQAKVAPDDGDSDDKFGGSVALSSDGSTALIGAYDDESPNGEYAGSVYIFDSSGSSWTQQVKLGADDGDIGDGFGVSVALSSDRSTALIGAKGDEMLSEEGDFSVSGVGSAYVFE